MKELQYLLSLVVDILALVVFLFSFFLVAALLSDTAKKKPEHLDAKLVVGSQFSSLEHKTGYRSLVPVLGGRKLPR